MDDWNEKIFRIKKGFDNNQENFVVLLRKNLFQLSELLELCKRMEVKALKETARTFQTKVTEKK